MSHLKFSEIHQINTLDSNYEEVEIESELEAIVEANEDNGVFESIERSSGALQTVTGPPEGSAEFDED